MKSLELTKNEQKKIIPPPTKRDIIEATALAMAEADIVRYEREKAALEAELNLLNKDSRQYAMEHIDQAEVSTRYKHVTLTIKLNAALKKRAEKIDRHLQRPKQACDFKSQLIQASKNAATSEIVQKLLSDDTIKNRLAAQGEKILNSATNKSAINV